jgi:hypothetical protein
VNFTKRRNPSRRFTIGRVAQLAEQLTLNQ